MANITDSCALLWSALYLSCFGTSSTCFFISHALVGVFQNDPGPPKYDLELRDYVKCMFFLHFILHSGLELKVQKVNSGVVSTLQ